MWRAPAQAELLVGINRNLPAGGCAPGRLRWGKELADTPGLWVALGSPAPMSWRGAAPSSAAGPSALVSCSLWGRWDAVRRALTR